MSLETFQIGKHVVLGREHTWRGCGSSKPPTFPISCLICISLIRLFLYNKLVAVVVQSFSHIRLFETPWTAARQASLSFTISRSLLKLMSIESVMASSHLILCHPRLLLPSILPSIRDFSDESALRIRWPKYCSFCFSISPSNEYSGLVSFRIDWLDLLAVQESLETPCRPKSLLWHHSSKASILRHLAFFMVQLFHPYVTTGKP